MATKKEKTKPTVEQAQADLIEGLNKLLRRVRYSHGRMLLDETVHKEKQDYSPELIESIEIQEALDLI